ncbi:thiosulfate:glutathione sulfurtransferase [Pristis pectinata]|uniref:thiosulfate:glutathione sulfurtransferase n=1 Tax=Pristis pectinata TaxID=685728 RepID=UPI00223CB185|nr:thiosulfate:glutathione sulfurtransferase [Pristis pectinata]
MFKFQVRSFKMITTSLTCNMLFRGIAAKVVSYEQLKQMIKDRAIQLYDVRQPEEMAKGKIPTSINIPLGQLETALKMDVATFLEIYKVQKPKKETIIVFQCQTGVRSASAVEIAQNLGFSKACHYKGGYTEWAKREGH